MAHDVFISYSSNDKTVADAVCATLERHQIRCWIAPRDVIPGEEWGQSIVRGINESRVIVLVFSSSANSSPQIRREIERAVNKGVIIVPFRIEDVPPAQSLEYFIGNVHWLDALTLPLETHLEHLAGTVKMLLDRMTPVDAPRAVAAAPAAPMPPVAPSAGKKPSAPPRDVQSPAPPPSRPSSGRWIAAVLVILLIGMTAAALYLYKRQGFSFSQSAPAQPPLDLSRKSDLPLQAQPLVKDAHRSASRPLSDSSAKSNPAAQLGSVLFRADMDCLLSVDGKEIATLKQGELRVVPLGFGQHVVDASNQQANLKWEQMITLNDAAQQMISSNLAAASKEADAKANPAPVTTSAKPVADVVPAKPGDSQWMIGSWQARRHEKATCGSGDSQIYGFTNFNFFLKLSPAGPNAMHGTLKLDMGSFKGGKALNAAVSGGCPGTSTTYEVEGQSTPNGIVLHALPEAGCAQANHMFVRSHFCNGEGHSVVSPGEGSVRDQLSLHASLLLGVSIWQGGDANEETHHDQTIFRKVQ